MIGSVALAATREQVERDLRSRRSGALLGVDRHGVVRNYHRPWEPADTGPLAWTYPVLAAIRDRLIDLYCRIDFDRIRRRGRVAEAAPEEADAAVELSAVDLAAGEPESEAGAGSDLPGRRPIPPLRFSRLARLLASDFGCKVGGGKGSEVKVYRPGGRIFVFGRHKADFVVHPAQLRLALNRLAIPSGEWLRVVYGAN